MEDLSLRRTCYHCKGQKFIRNNVCNICQGRGWIIPVPKPKKTKKKISKSKT